MCDSVKSFMENEKIGNIIKELRKKNNLKEWLVDYVAKEQVKR